MKDNGLLVMALQQREVSFAALSTHWDVREAENEARRQQAMVDQHLKKRREALQASEHYSQENQMLNVMKYRFHVLKADAEQGMSDHARRADDLGGRILRQVELMGMQTKLVKRQS